MGGLFFLLLFGSSIYAEDICLPDDSAVSSQEYLATIKIQTEQGNCTATIVGFNVILTAAHCGYEKDDSDEKVIPEGKTGTFTFGGKEYVFTFAPSTRTDKDVRLGLKPDVSLGIVHSTIENAVPLSIGFETPRDPLLVLGFGRGRLSKYLARTDYEDTFKRHMISSNSKNRYSCPGDSGGPTLAYDKQNKIKLVGVHASTDLNKYTRDTRTNSEAFKTFIKEKATENNLSICGFNLICSNYFLY